jgi:hypothetical protein
VDDPRKRVVQLGYDTIAERYLTWGGHVEGDPRDRFLGEFVRRLADGARVLDLGCAAAGGAYSAFNAGSAGGVR